MQTDHEYSLSGVYADTKAANEHLKWDYKISLIEALRSLINNIPG